MAELIWRAPGGEEERVPLPADGGIIGRSEGADIRIPHPSISRRHARLRPEVSGSWRITDLGSRNGVIVRSRRVNEAELAPADPIQLGDIVLAIAGEARATADPPGGASVLPAALVAAPATDDAPPATPFPFDLLAERLAIEPPPATPDRTPDPATPSVLPASGGDDERAMLLARVAELRASAEEAVESAGTAPGTDAAESGAKSIPESTARREGVFRSSERKILFVVALLLAAAALIITFGPESPAPRADPVVSEESTSREPAENEPGAAANATAAAPAAPVARSLGGAREDARKFGYERRIPERIASLPPGTVEFAWRATAFLHGRAPTPAEMALLGEEGPDALLAAARAEPEHWRHRARAALVRGGAAPSAPLPAELLPAEVPLDPANWAERLRRLARGASEDPLPAPDGADVAYTEAYGRALAAPPRPPADLGAALRSAWTAGAGRALDAEVEGWLDELARSGIAPDELLHRLLLLLAPAHPAVRAGVRTEELARWLPPWEGEASPLAPPVAAGGERPAGDAAAAGEAVPAELWWAVAVERRLALPAPAAPLGGPPGRLRIEVLAPVPLRPVLAAPERIPRLWRRLDRSRLTIHGRSDRPAGELHRLASLPDAEEAWIIAEGASDADVAEETAGIDRARARVADGFLLPALGDIARRLGVHPAREALSPAVAAWLAAARAGRSAAGERLFRAGGYHLVPGEWRAAAYRPATRALLLAGAHLLEHPGAASVARVRLDEEPREGTEGEWEEWMTALELVAGRCDGHSFSLWLWGPAEGGSGSLALAVEWGPEVRRGWVTEEDRPAEALHPRLAASHAPPPAETATEPAPAAATGEEGG